MFHHVFIYMGDLPLAVQLEFFWLTSRVDSPRPLGFGVGTKGFGARA